MTADGERIDRPGHEMFLGRRVQEAPELDELRAVLSLPTDPSAGSP